MINQNELEKLINQYSKVDAKMYIKLNSNFAYYVKIFNAVLAYNDLNINSCILYYKYQNLGQFKNVSYEEIQSFKRLQIDEYVKAIDFEINAIQRRSEIRLIK